MSEIINKIIIGTTTFRGNSNITSVDLSNNEWTYNTMYYAFNGCINLKSINNINENVTNMFGTFRYCYNLVNVPVIPNSVTYMGETFYKCTNLVNAPVIPNSVTNMGHTFFYCNNLVNVPTIPNSVTNMCQTFGYCHNLVNVPVIPNSVTDMSFTFRNCYNLVNVPIIPNSVTNMYYTFHNCRNLVNVPIIPNSVINMHDTFDGCSNLAIDVHILSDKITDATNCFKSTTATKNVYIPFYKPSSTMYCFRVMTKSGAIDVYTYSLDESSSTIEFNSIEDVEKLTEYTNISSYDIVGAPNITYGQFGFGGTVEYFGDEEIKTKELIWTWYPMGRYEDGDVVSDAEYTTTYNSFINAGYDENGTQHGVYLKDLNSL